MNSQLSLADELIRWCQLWERLEGNEPSSMRPRLAVHLPDGADISEVSTGAFERPFEVIAKPVEHRYSARQPLGCRVLREGRHERHGIIDTEADAN